MLNKVNPATTKSWQNLHRHYEKTKNLHMKTLFAENPQRFNEFSIRFNDILVDYSKNRITEQTLEGLIALAKECGLKNAIEKMFKGEKINETENRAVLHIALVTGRDIAAKKSPISSISVSGDRIWDRLWSRRL